MRRLLSTLLLVTAALPGVASVVRDCKPWWEVWNGTRYQPAVLPLSDTTRSVYFFLSAADYRGQRLEVSATTPWHLFINGQLAGSGTRRVYDLDSLARRYSASMFIGVYGVRSLPELQTRIVSVFDQSGVDLDPVQRQSSHFSDFSILASAILLIFFLILLRSNPQLTLDYFTFTKIFSVQERNENLLVSRITSSVNLLFYLFCALLMGLLLTQVFYFASSFFPFADPYAMQTLGDTFVAWGRWSALVLLLLATKLTVVSMISSLFDFRESVSFQFFNFLRFVLFTAVLATGLCLLYFMVGGQSPLFYYRLILLALLLLGIGSVMVLIKLLPRSPFSLFHLFSYLCASEIIPLVIIIKLFF